VNPPDALKSPTPAELVNSPDQTSTDWLLKNEEFPLPVRLEAVRQRGRLYSTAFYADRERRFSLRYWLESARSYQYKD